VTGKLFWWYDYRFSRTTKRY